MFEAMEPASLCYNELNRYVACLLESCFWYSSLSARFLSLFKFFYGNISRKRHVFATVFSGRFWLLLAVAVVVVILGTDISSLFLKAIYGKVSFRFGLFHCRCHFPGVLKLQFTVVFKFGGSIA